jgi:hypothetical protein
MATTSIALQLLLVHEIALAGNCLVEALMYRCLDNNQRYRLGLELRSLLAKVKLMWTFCQVMVN